MASIFDALKKYATSWEEKSRRPFSAEEIAQAKSAFVVESQYGLSVKFTVPRGIVFIPLSNQSTLTAGEAVDLTKAVLVTLSKEGEIDIVRVEI